MKLKYCNSTAVESSASSDPPQLSNHDYIFTPHLVLCPPPALLIRITTTVTMLKNSRILHLSSETWCFDELWETRLLLWLLSFTLTPPPEPISQSALSCSHPSLRPIPHLPQVTRLICSCSSRTHSNVEVHLFTPGISDPWEACCVPQMLFLIYLGMWVLMLHSSWIFQSSTSCHVSCPSVSTVEGGWGEPILGLNPLLSTSEMKQGWRDSRWIKERSVLKCCNMFSDPCRQWLLKAADVTCLGCKVNMIDS